MKTADFIKRYCIGETCPDFDGRYGCRAYDGEECNAAFHRQKWHGLSMVERINMLCEKKRKKVLE